MLPECSPQAEAFRLKLYCSVADIEMMYTDSGWPTPKKTEQAQVALYKERPTKFMIPQTHASDLEYVVN